MLKTSQDDHDSKNLAKVKFYQKRKGKGVRGEKKN
jgi:hypothetical protein